MTQGDLFDSPTPGVIVSKATDVGGAPSGGATIIAFPQNRNVGRIRRVALKLSERDGKLKEAYWNRSCNDLASMLIKAGLSEAHVQAQLYAFHEAVNSELYRLANAGCRQPGGAA
ncbi:MAG: DUF6074 family protein [Cypionkella sp.]